MAEAVPIYSATGKRKTAVARVWLKPGDGKFKVNSRTLEEYFGGLETSKIVLKQPLEITNTLGRFDIQVTVRGGGVNASAGAIRHGITRALLRVDPGYRIPLKRAGLITRDSRIKEKLRAALAWVDRLQRAER